MMQVRINNRLSEILFFIFFSSPLRSCKTESDRDPGWRQGAGKPYKTGGRLRNNTAGFLQELL